MVRNVKENLTALLSRREIMGTFVIMG